MGGAMENLTKALRDKFIENIAEAIDKQVDLKKLTEDTHAELVKRLGPSIVEKLEDGLLTDMLFEMAEGMYIGEIKDLARRAREWADKLDPPVKS